jgi:hypothetical protein
MSVQTQAMDRENCFLQYKSDCTQLVLKHHCVRASKASWNGVHIHVVQLVSFL